MSTLGKVMPELWRLEFVEYKKGSDDEQGVNGPTVSTDSSGDSPEGDLEESLFEDDESEEQDDNPKKVKMSKKKKALIGGGIGTGIAGSVLVLLVGFLPSRLIGTVKNLQDNFFANVNSVVDERTDTLVSGYLKKYVMPSLGVNGECSSTRATSKCSAAPDGTGRISKLYRAWSDNRFENKLATKYGLEFGKDAGNYYLIGSSGRIDLGDDTNGFRASNLGLEDYLSNHGISSSSRSEVRRAVSNALEGETFFKRMLHRYKIGKLLERKYGIKRCVILCNARDDFADWKDNKSKAAKMLIVERVILPRNERLGVLMGCIISGNCTSPGAQSSDGEHRSALETEAQKKLEAYAARFGTEKAEKIIAAVTNVADKGVERYVIEEVVTKIFSQEAGQAAGKAVPVIGWVAFGAQVVKTLSDAPGVFKKMTYAANAVAAVQLYMMYVSHVDEIKSGHVDMAMVGSFSNALSDIGNGGSAESSPLYQHLFASSNGSDSAFNLFSSTTFASGGQYVCNDKKVIAADQLVCPEDKLDGGNLLTDVLNLTSDAVAPLKSVSDLWYAEDPVIGISLNSIYSHATGWLGDIAQFTLDHTPGLSWAYHNAMDGINNITQKFLSSIATALLPSPFPDSVDDTSGSKTFTMMAAGGDVSANYYAHYGLGGRVLTDAEVTGIRNNEATKRLEDFEAKPLYARLFDTTEPMSAVSKVAMSMPVDGKGLVQTFLGSIFNLPKLFGSIGNFFFGSPKTDAASYPAGDPFNVVQYGYPLGSDLLKSDTEAMSDEQCDAEIKAWEDSAVDHDDAESTHDTVSLCKLDRAIAAAAGGIYDPSLIDEDQNSATPVSTTPSPSTTSDEMTQKIKADGQKDCPTTHGIRAGSTRSAKWKGTDLSFKTCILANGAEVNTIYAESFALLFEKAQAAGQDLAAGGGSFREYSAAVTEWHNRCGSSYPLDASWAEPPCSGVRMAHPGSSFHEVGLAADLTCNGASLGGGTTTRDSFNPKAPCMQFVINNSPSLGLYLQCEGKTASGDWVVKTNCESWHISPTGG